MTLHYPKNLNLNLRRRKNGDSFSFVDEDGKVVSEKDRERILEFAIPPAWTEVLIASDPLSYIQVIGTDAKRRKQYIYHPDLVKHNQKHKFEQMVSFGEALPELRKTVDGHMKDPTLTRNRIVATVVWLLEHTFIRVGNKVYAEENQSYGLTTMRNKHVDVVGNKVTFSFRGKSGVDHELGVTHPTVAKTVKKCIDLPGYELFQYIDENKQPQTIDSADVNEYLQTYAGSDFSAKDFRTWGGSVMAGESLYTKGNGEDAKGIKKNIIDAVSEVSKLLGNTKTVCRTYYIHPKIIKSYEGKELIPHFAHSLKRQPKDRFDLKREEYATWSLIKGN